MPCKQENGMFLNMQVLNMHVLDGMPGFTVSGHYMPGQNAILPRFAGFRGGPYPLHCCRNPPVAGPSNRA